MVRAVAAADGAIGQLLGCHYFVSWSARLLSEPALAARLDERSAAERWCWSGGFTRQEPPLMMTATGDGLVLDGRQSYASGVLVADRIAVRAVREDTGEPLAVVVDPTRPGVVVDGDADTFGHRLAAGGSVEFDAVRVRTDEVVGSLSADEEILTPRAALTSPVGRLLSAQLCLGMAEGVLAEAREHSRADRSPWAPARPLGSAHDPQVLSAHEELTVLARTASALADQALDAVPAGPARGEDLAYDECAEISGLATMAEPPPPGPPRSPPHAPLRSSAPGPPPPGRASTASGATPAPTPCASRSDTGSGTWATTSSKARIRRSRCRPESADRGLPILMCEITASTM